MPTPGIAANAYAQLARITESASGLVKSTAAPPEEGAASFGALLKDALNGVAAAGRKSDFQAQSLAEAETAVSALVAVRDNVIQSYQAVMSMTI